MGWDLESSVLQAENDRWIWQRLLWWRFQHWSWNRNPLLFDEFRRDGV